MFDDDSWGDGLNSEIPVELLIAYDDMLNGHPTKFLEEDDYELIVEYFFQNGKEAESLKACELALQYYPISTTLLLLHAEVLFQAERFGQSLHTLDTVYALSGDMLEATLLRSDIFLSQGKTDKAIQFLKEKSVVFEGKERVEVLQELADVYDENGNFDLVFYTLKSVLELTPQNEDALHKIGFWADLSGLQEESRELHQKLVDKDPFNALIWFNIGMALQGLRRHKDAIEAYQYCLDIDEKFEMAYRNLADAYMRINRYREAIEALEKNLQFSKPEDVIYEALGHCFEKQKKFSQARDYYRKALRLNPADDTIFFRIGETYSRERHWEQAARSYSKALTLNKDNADCLLSLGNCLLEMDAGLEALTCFFNAIKLKPTSKRNWMALLEALYKNECYDELIGDIDIAREAMGNKPDFDYLKALALLALGKSKESVVYLERGLAQAPQKIKWLLNLKPDLLQYPNITRLIATYKRKK